MGGFWWVSFYYPELIVSIRDEGEAGKWRRSKEEGIQCKGVNETNLFISCSSLTEAPLFLCEIHRKSFLCDFF